MIDYARIIKRLVKRRAKLDWRRELVEICNAKRGTKLTRRGTGLDE